LLKEPEFMDESPEELEQTGVRAAVVAMKLRNGSGAKGPQEGGYVKT